MTNQTTAHSAIVAEGAVWAWKLINSPRITEIDPMRTATTIIAGTRRTSRAAAAGGAVRKPNTSIEPTASKDATTDMATTTNSTPWVRLGRRPKSCAWVASNV